MGTFTVTLCTRLSIVMVLDYILYLLVQKKPKTSNLKVKMRKTWQAHTYTHLAVVVATHRHIKTNNTTTAKVLMKYARGKGYLLDGRLSNLSKRHFAQVYTDTSLSHPSIVSVSPPVFDFFVSPVWLSSETH